MSLGNTSSSDGQCAWTGTSPEKWRARWHDKSPFCINKNSFFSLNFLNSTFWSWGFQVLKLCQFLPKKLAETINFLAFVSFCLVYGLFLVFASSSRYAFCNFGEDYCHHLQGDSVWFTWMLIWLENKCYCLLGKLIGNLVNGYNERGDEWGLFMGTNALLTLTSAFLLFALLLVLYLLNTFLLPFYWLTSFLPNSPYKIRLYFPSTTSE
jgi:hypothetical protein